MKKEDNIYSMIELDIVSSSILNALNAQIAIINPDGNVVAFNQKWKLFRESLQENWSHPGLEANILKSLQTPLAEGNDFALRLLLGIKDVLGREINTFETKYRLTSEDQEHWFKITITSLGIEQGAVLVYEDISAQIESSKYLKETRQKFENHFHNSLYGILISDENHSVIEANSVACNILGTTREAITYSTVNNYLNVDLDIEHIQKRINREGNYIGESEIIAVDGKKIPIELSVTLFRNEDGKPISSWAFKDISDKKITEQALKETEQQYKMQFNNTLEGIFIGRPNGLILKANPAACDILGYTAEELEGQHRDIIFDLENPSNAAAVANRREKGSIKAEVEFTHKDGHKIPVEVSSVIFNAEDGTEKTIINIKDISSRKSVEKQLIAEKEFTESAISSLPTAFFVFSTEGEMIRWNDVLEEDLGYTAREIARMNVMQLVHPDDRPVLEDILAGELVGNRVSIEARCITKAGKTLHYLLSGTSFEQNGETYIVGGGLNRNNIKEIEKEKNRNAELLSQLFENSPIGIVLIDTNGIVQNSNKSFEQIFGYTPEELSGQNLDHAIVQNYMDQQAKTLSRLSFTGDTFQTETMRVNKAGQEIPVLIGGVPVEVDGEVIAIYGMYVDISERKELENQIVELLETEKKARLHMQDMFEEAPSAIAMLEGEDHRFTFANDTSKKLINKEDLVDKPVSEVLPEIVEQGFIELLDICYSEGKVFNFNEKKVYFNNGDISQPTIHYLNFVFKPLRNDDNKVYGIFIEAVDVTEQVKTRNLIEKSLAEKNTLLGEVHHRVKNNLAIISGLLELELMGTPDQEVGKHLQSTQARITSIAKIHELLYQNESLSHVNFKNYIESILSSESKNPERIIQNFDLQDVNLNVNQAIPTSMLLNEIISCLKDINCQNYGEGSGDLTFVLKEANESVSIEFKEGNRALFKDFNNCDKVTSELRMELIEVLLRQIRGKMNISADGQGTLTINFAKREAKGPHNALIN
ncbi:MAG: PAS domain S-box protein [Gracilimonas sp.]|uniref:PAS domain S-box protein n=1 Tax=Gracilimonas sp. TaxID=1974203 RepID=UPI0019A9DBAB|nr:PAS domain S-box protein [Gracilimonas sp.]MBD3616922.1 PAS domain S-box protein [Gracilimonas sp.]